VITIVGGGIAGASLAWALAGRGRRDVTVYDERPIGSGSTGKAFGGFRTQQGSALNVALSLAARDVFEARAERIRFLPVGYLYLAENEAAAAALAERAERQRAWGLPIEHPDPLELAPFLVAGDVLATNYCALDGTYAPADVLGCLVEEARERGATFHYGRAADAAALDADTVVVCAGIWAGPVGEALGVRLQVAPVERGIFDVGPFDWMPSGVPVVLDVGSGYHLRERDRHLLIIGPGDPHAWEHHRAWLAHRAPRAAVAEPCARWTGHYEVTFDHHPLAGPTERDGVWAMCGFSGHGVMHSPAVAESLAAMMLGETPPVDIVALDPRRTEPLHDDTQL
jgi:sarcosine oxidase subunit beta